MKLNYRDKMILTVLIVLFVWAIGIMFFIKPAIENVGTAQQTLDDSKATLATLEARIEQDKDLDARIDAAYAEVTQLSNSFYTYQVNQDATQLIDDLLDTDEIVNTDMSISAYTAYTLSPYKSSVESVFTDVDLQVLDYEEKAKAAEAETGGETAEVDPDAVAPADTTIGNYAISFSYEAESLDDVIAFCDKLQSTNTEKTIVVNSLSMQVDEVMDGSTTDLPCSGSISLNLLVVRKLPDPSTLA